MFGGSGQEPEEPDFFFLSGGPYTQGRYSPQLIWANQWSYTNSQALRVRDFVGAGRFEFGVTSNLEADFQFGGRWARYQPEVGPALTDSGSDGLMLGIRYRILKEDFAPFTLTVGPQLIFPPATGRLRSGVGYGVDVTAAKDWGGPIFTAASWNRRTTPSGADPLSPLPQRLTQSSYAIALGLRPFERETSVGTKHDLHLFLEALRTGEDSIEEHGVVAHGSKLLAPGLRFGYVNKSGVLTEVGLSMPIGLDESSAGWGAVLQFQIEMPSVF